MTTEDILTNPALFERKYRRVHDRLAIAQQKLLNANNRLAETRARLKNANDMLRQFTMKEEVKKQRGEALAFDNKLRELFSVIQPYYPNCTIEAIKRPGRKREVVEPRHIMCYFLREKYRFSWKLIGRVMGNRDHSTAISGYNTIEDLYAYDKQFRIMLDKIKEEVKNI